ncbi:MAG: radical SAM protein [Candidatus Kaelpia aquatica]|nr:radical SAM protein [Candidatus Kaelpia aquatica]
MSKKIVLMNSVGKDDLGRFIIHSPSRWSEGVKELSSWFNYYPWELAYAAALLKKSTPYKIKLIDPCLKRWNKEETLSNILEENPDWLIIESATRTISENLWVGKSLKKMIQTKIVFVGQHATAFPQDLISKGVDYVAIGEYEETLLEFLVAEDSSIAGLYPNQRRLLMDIAKLPWPEDEDVKRIEYGSPGEPSSEYLEIQAYASRGCYGNCSFCVARNMYYNQPKQRFREVGDIISEIEYLKNSYPQLEGIFFDEESHNSSKNFTKKLMSAIISSGLNNLKYEAMCDLRFLDRESMDHMKAAGYYKVRFGIETASEELASSIAKPVSINEVLTTLSYAKEIELKTYTTFMLGLPGSNIKKDGQTIDFISHIIKQDLVDNVQISLATPQPGTPFYDWAKERGFITDNDPHSFDGGGPAILNYPDYGKKEIERSLKMAIAKRDHLFFINKMREHPLDFVAKRYKRYGLKLLIEKLLRRIKTELSYFKLFKAR